MLIIDLLDKQTRDRLKVKPTKPKPKRKRYKPPKSKQELSKREWEDIMGMRRDIYTRRNGAVVRK